LQPELIAGFENIYQNLKSKEEQSHDDARKEANDFIIKGAQEAAQRQRPTRVYCRGGIASGDKPPV
jgi:hypothetical protein